MEVLLALTLLGFRLCCLSCCKLGEVCFVLIHGSIASSGGCIESCLGSGDRFTGGIELLLCRVDVPVCFGEGFGRGFGFVPLRPLGLEFVLGRVPLGEEEGIGGAGFEKTLVVFASVYRSAISALMVSMVA